MGTYCTFCRVAGPDIFDPPEHLPTCRYYPVEAKNRDKTIQQLAEQIAELKIDIEEQINLTSELTKDYREECIELRAENKRLKEHLKELLPFLKSNGLFIKDLNWARKLRNEIEKDLAATPQKESENEVQKELQ